MPFDFDEITTHTSEDDCPACRAEEIARAFLVPAAAAWEATHNLPQFSLAAHGAAGLIGAMLEAGVDREEIEAALSHLIDDLEEQIAEDKMMGGPPQGSA